MTKEQSLSSRITPSSLTTRSWFRLAMMLPSSISSFFLSLEKSRGSNTLEKSPMSTINWAQIDTKISTCVVQSMQLSPKCICACRSHSSILSILFECLFIGQLQVCDRHYSVGSTAALPDIQLHFCNNMFFVVVINGNLAQMESICHWS